MNLMSFEQIGLDNINDGSEQDLFLKIYKLINDKYDDSENVTMEQKKAYLSICLFGVPKLRIKTIYNEVCIHIPQHFNREIEQNNIETKMMADHYYRIQVPQNKIDSSLKALLFDIYEYCLRKYSDERFDCCSKYMECSDNKKCCYEDDKFGHACSYRYTMTDKGGGKIFYGKNRNIK